MHVLKHHDDTERSAEQQFEATIQRYQSMISGICVTFFPHDAYRRADLLQTILEKQWDNFVKFLAISNEADQAAWVFTMARNVARTYWRQCKSRDGVFSSLEATVSDVADADEADEADEISDEEQIATLYRFIETLPDEDARLLLMYINRFTQQKMAEALHLEPGNVGMRICRLKKKLRQMRQQEQEECQ